MRKDEDGFGQFWNLLEMNPCLLILQNANLPTNMKRLLGYPETGPKPGKPQNCKTNLFVLKSLAWLLCVVLMTKLLEYHFCQCRSF
jgi:hypothetical protein